MGVIKFNYVSSEDYGIHVETPPEYAAPKRDYEVFHILGKNGDIIIDHGSYQNVTRTYDISFGEYDGDFTSFASGVSEWLYSPSGYARLEDSYEPDYYRQAYYSGDLDIENIFHHGGKASLEFTCKPQRFLKSPSSYSIKGTASITNPTKQIALPYIQIQMPLVSGSVSSPFRFRINDILIVATASSAASYYIDSEEQTITNVSGRLVNDGSVILYNETESAENRTLDFPTLKVGTNTITFVDNDYGSNYFLMKPRWWTL